MTPGQKNGGGGRRRTGLGSSGLAGQRPEARTSAKIYYKLSDIAAALEVEKHVLKYWEEAFNLIKPVKVGRRLNLYNAEDFEKFKEIRQLVHIERYTIEGAKMRMAQRGFLPVPPKTWEDDEDDQEPEDGSLEEGQEDDCQEDEYPGEEGEDDEGLGDDEPQGEEDEIEEGQEDEDEYEDQDLDSSPSGPGKTFGAVRIKWSEGISDLLRPRDPADTAAAASVPAAASWISPSTPIGAPESAEASEASGGLAPPEDSAARAAAAVATMADAARQRAMDESGQGGPAQPGRLGQRDLGEVIREVRDELRAIRDFMARRRP
jgi:DNA-binding transcriptional MerR regulator